MSVALINANESFIVPFCSIASPFIDVLEDLLKDEEKENGDHEINSDEQDDDGEENDTSESNSLNYQKLCSGEDLTADDDDDDQEEGMHAWGGYSLTRG